MTANVWIETGTSGSSLLIPASAITRTDKGPQVQIYTGGSLRSQSVDTGLTDQKGMVEVVSGLSEGDQVVVGFK